MPASALGDRLQYRAARLMDALPTRAKIALSGEPAIIIDGQQLDPQAQLLRTLRRRRMPFGLIEPTIAAGRARYRRQAEIFTGPSTPVGAVRDFEIPGPAEALRVRHYSPADQQAAPLLVYLHGGGFVIGDLDTHDEPCRILCRDARTHVLSIDYRLTPEHPFPAALDDARAAYRWARSNAGSLGADAARVAVGGDSAGGNLGAVVSILERDEGLPPSAQLLIYPATDASTARPSRQMFDGGFVLTRHDYDEFFDCYAGTSRRNVSDPRLSPLRASNLSHLPPALVVIAGFDILRDEGEAYARALEDAGTTAHVVRCLDLEHGFIHMTGICSAARRAMLSIAREWAAVIDNVSSVPATAFGS